MPALDGPVFKLTIAGRELPQAMISNVVEIDVDEELGRLARATVVIRNWDPDRVEPESEDSDQPQIAVGQELLVELGEGSELTEIFDGLIVTTDVRFAARGYPVLAIGCRCRGIKLVGARNNAVWSESSDLDAVTKICQAAGLTVNGESTPAGSDLVQYRASDWRFVLDRGAALGRQVYVRKQQLNFGKPAVSGSAMATLKWRDTLWELQMSQDISAAIGKATASSWDPVEKALVTASTESGSATLPGSGEATSVASALSTAGMSSRAAAEVDVGLLAQGELQTWTQAIVDRHALGGWNGRGRCQGDAKIRIDGPIEIRGAGKTYDGKHYVTRTHHRLVPGLYQTTFWVGRPPRARPPARRDDAELLPRADRLVIASVDSFKDEQQQGRVSIRLPWMTEQNPPIWARLATPAAGADRGFVYIPEPDDEVVAMFLDGDPRFPVVLGALWNGKDAPPDTYDPEANNTRSIVSRSGHKIVLDDTEGAERVRVESQASQMIEIDDSSGEEAITLTDKHGNKLRMESSGVFVTAATGKKIALSASGGTIELSANEIKLDADSNASIQAQMNVKLQGTTGLDLKGGQVSIDGTGLISAEAPMIKLN